MQRVFTCAEALRSYTGLSFDASRFVEDCMVENEDGKDEGIVCFYCLGGDRTEDNDIIFSFVRVVIYRNCFASVVLAMVRHAPKAIITTLPGVHSMYG